MKNISKRIMCIALSLLCVFMSTYTVYAGNSGESNWEHLSNGHVVVNGAEYEPVEEDQYMHELYYIMNHLGVVGKVGKAGVDITASMMIIGESLGNNDTPVIIRDDSGNLYFRLDRKTEDGDDITFSSDYVNDVRNGIANIIQTEDGFSYVPTLKFDCLPYSYFSCDSAYGDFKKWGQLVSSGNYIGGMIQGSFPIQQYFNFGIADISNVKYLYFTQPLQTNEYFQSPNADIGFCDGVRPINVRGGVVWNYEDLSDLGDSGGLAAYYGTSTSKFYSTGYGREICAYTWSSDGRTLKVYNSIEAVENAENKHGVQNYYTSNTYNNYNVNNDNSITINKNVYKNTDYETINNNNYTTINKTVNKYYEENNTTIDTSSIEDILKKFEEDQAKRDQELLDKVDDNNDKVDESNQISKETNEKLDKIYEILQQIASGLSDDNSGSSGSGFDMNTLIQMLNNLQLSLDTMWQVDLKQIQSNLNTIVNDLKSDNADSRSILEDIYKTQQQILEVQQAHLEQNKTFFDTVIDYLKKITHAITAGNIIDTLDTLLNIKDDVDALDDFVDGIVEDLTPTVELVKTKFPTSIPWDIIGIVSIMACEPQTPKFEIPIHFNVLGQQYDDVLVIDLEQFDRVARFGRALLSVMFTLWLLLVTKRMLYGGE